MKAKFNTYLEKILPYFDLSPKLLFCTMALSPLLSHLRGGWPLIFLAF
jgi:hypothetical protein